MSVAVPIITAVIGAIAAALTAQYVRRSKPLLIVDELARSPDVTPHRAGAVANLDLAAACADSEFIPSELSLATHDERISEKDYVDRLHAVLDQAEISIEGLPAITEVARTLNDCLQREDYEAFQSTFGREFLRVWPLLIVGYSRGRFDYTTPGPTPLPETSLAAGSGGTAGGDGEESPGIGQCIGVRARSSVEGKSVEFSHAEWKHTIVQDLDGHFHIPLTGPRNLLFLWNFVSMAQLAAARSFAQRTAISFASDFRSDLQEITNYLLGVEDGNRPLLESLRGRLETELQLYERIVIKGFVANRGGAPVTVTNAARLFVELAGYSFTDDNRVLKSHGANQEIEMVIGADREDGEPAFDSAMTVSGGSVARFAATSRKRLQDLPDPEILVRAMTGGERKCYLGLMTVSQGRSRVGRSRSRSQLTAAYTERQPFRDSASEVEVPPQDPGGVDGFLSRMGLG